MTDDTKQKTIPVTNGWTKNIQQSIIYSYVKHGFEYHSK